MFEELFQLRNAEHVRDGSELGVAGLTNSRPDVGHSLDNKGFQLLKMSFHHTGKILGAGRFECQPVEYIPEAMVAHLRSLGRRGDKRQGGNLAE